MLIWSVFVFNSAHIKFLILYSFKLQCQTLDRIGAKFKLWPNSVTWLAGSGVYLLGLLGSLSASHPGGLYGPDGKGAGGKVGHTDGEAPISGWCSLRWNPAAEKLALSLSSSGTLRHWRQNQSAQYQTSDQSLKKLIRLSFFYVAPRGRETWNNKKKRFSRILDGATRLALMRALEWALTWYVSADTSTFISHPDLIQRLAIKGISGVSWDMSSGGSF